ncbi:MAG TPA: ADOP family duplicated permease [Gemmatimonadaceae bacterium]|nr:ADOP family duplicated permease [Gemmatimonadaceae bacterium]
MLDTVRRDLSYTARTLRRSPTFSVTVVLILGLAIGMSSAMFTVFRAVLLERLPVQQQDRIVELSGVAGGAASEVPILPSQLRRLRDQSRTLQAAAGMAHWRVFADALLDGDRRLSLREAVVTDQFFNVLGARPAAGRLFHTGDAVQWGAAITGRAPVAVLSHAAWMRYFGGDPSILGRSIRSPKMNWTMTIVGVAPPGLDYPRGVEYWVAADYGSLDVVARLAPNATPETARQEFQAFLAHDPDVAKYEGGSALGAQVHTLTQMVIGDARPALLALGAAVALLLVLACTNIGNLLLLRAASRVREMAVRRALGASAADLVRQLLCESVLLALAGGTLGVLLARVLLDALVRLAPTGLPRTDLITVAGTPLLAGAVVTAATAVLFGAIPAFVAVRFDLSSPLRSDTRSGTEGRRLRRVRQALVASQIALAMIVLAGAGLLVRSLARLTALDLGYETAHVTMLNFSLPWVQYAGDCKPAGTLTAADSVRWNRCYSTTNYTAHERVMTNLRAVPGVEAVSPEAVPPFLGTNVWEGRFAAQEQTTAESKANPWFGFDAVGPEFFRALGAPIVAGRAFTDADNEDAPRVAVITERVAKQLWPNQSYQSVVGKRLRESEDQTPDSLITVVGVARDFHYRQHRESTPTVFRPYRQVLAQGYLVVRTHGSGVSASAMRRAVEDAGGGATFIRAESMDDLIAPQLATPKFDALLLSIFALAAVVLAAVGLYGIMASAVAQQQRELGIRMALGATSNGVRNMVLRQAFTVAGAGTIVGLAGALVGSRLLTSMLFGVTPFDPPTLAGVSLLLLAIAAVAAYIPARRATTIDPARALRAE